MELYEGETVGSGDGGGDPPNDTSVRISVLETQVAHIQGALSEIRGDLKDVIGKLGHLPTKQDLINNVAVIVTIGLAIIAIVVTGIVGGLAWIEPKAPPAVTAAPAAPAPAPIIIQVPYPVQGKSKN